MRLIACLLIATGWGFYFTGRPCIAMSLFVAGTIVGLIKFLR